MLGCRGVSRADFRLDDTEPGRALPAGGEHQPGMTPPSWFPSRRRTSASALPIWSCSWSRRRDATRDARRPPGAAVSAPAAAPALGAAPGLHRRQPAGLGIAFWLTSWVMAAASATPGTARPAAGGLVGSGRTGGARRGWSKGAGGRRPKRCAASSAFTSACRCRGRHRRAKERLERLAWVGERRAHAARCRADPSARASAARLVAARRAFRRDRPRRRGDRERLLNVRRESTGTCASWSATALRSRRRACSPFCRPSLLCPARGRGDAGRRAALEPASRHRVEVWLPERDAVGAWRLLAEKARTKRCSNGPSR